MISPELPVCHDSKQYIGLNTVEECATCGGNGTVAE